MPEKHSKWRSRTALAKNKTCDFNVFTLGTTKKRKTQNAWKAGDLKKKKIEQC